MSQQHVLSAKTAFWGVFIEYFMTSWSKEMILLLYSVLADFTSLPCLFSILLLG